MSFFKNLKTSDKISLQFSMLNFLSLIFLLFCINIIYFSIWYNDQKEVSLYDVNINYDSYTGNMSDDNLQAFKNYILQQDSIIISNSGELACSEGVSKKIHDDIEVIKDKYFYTTQDKIYFIFSNTYDEIGEVKVLFDTTSYIKSQVIIIKVSLIIICIWMILSFFIAKLLSRYLFKDLKKISKEASEINIDNFKHIQLSLREDDELQMLVDTMNKSFDKIECQTKNLKQFITDVSHEFKTPLMVINSKIDLYNKKCEKGKCGIHEITNLHTAIKTSTKRLNKLLETLFLLSRKTEEIENFKKESVNISEYIPLFCDNFISNIPEKQIEIHYKIKKHIFLNIEKTTFDIILENFLTNAVKFSNNPVKIEVGISEKSFYVRDHGTGISQENLDKIWSKFYRKDTKLEGFGVGLFLVKRVIDMYNWDVQVTSKKTKGSKFSVYFK